MKQTSQPADEQRRKSFIFGGMNTSSIETGRAQKLQKTFRDVDRKFEERQTASRARELGVAFFDLTGFPVDQTALTLVDRSVAAAAETVPFYQDGQYLKFATVNPGNSRLAKLVDGFQKKNFSVDIYLVSKSSFSEALSRYQMLKVQEQRQEEVHVLPETSESLASLRQLEAAGVGINKISATNLVSILLTAAQSMEASDIHLQPESDHLVVRFRVDGVLQDVVKLHSSAIKSLISRIKILSKLKINVTKVPQDGSFVIPHNGVNLEIRVSLLPSAYGEAIVLRLLGSQEALNLEQLGLRGIALNKVKSEIEKPNGLILTTGPTGSGKTTTLYAFLKQVNKPGIKIITLENPVEYRMEGIEQIQIEDRGGLTFSNALRSTLRQDPDVLMVGEIRDIDTAEAAAQAALTGHMVYSTLHTNDAAGAIPRLLNLGVRPVILAPALAVVIAQRLVRKLCDKCRREGKLDSALLKRVEHVLESIPKNAGVEVPKQHKFFESPGCAVCNNLGYRGRIGVFEVFVVDDKMEQLIYKEASTVEVRRLAEEQGMISMIQDGLLKAMEGITDVAEVLRVTEE